MPGINPMGKAGSIDVQGLVNKLLKADGGPPLERLDKQEAKVQSDISALGSFRSSLSDFQQTLGKLRKPDDLRQMNATSSDKDKIEVTASPKAQEGSYKVDVEQLAQAQRLTSQVFHDDLAPIGKGSMTFQFGRIDPHSGKFVPNPKTPVKTIHITDGNNSLRGIRNAVNEAGFGVRASLINDGKGTRLVFSSNGTGEINGLRVVVNDDDGNNLDKQGLSRLSYDPTKPGHRGVNMIESTKAQDAIVDIDGIKVTSPSNHINKAIDGVMMTIKGTTGNTPVKLTTSFDVAGVTKAIETFVKKYNAMIDNVQKIAGYDAKTKVAGPLSGDAAVRGIVEQIQRTLGMSFGGINRDYNSLASIGITTQNDGTLLVDNSKLRKAVSTDMLQVSKLFARAGSTTDSLIRYVKASDDAKMGAYDIYIGQTATEGHYIGTEPAKTMDFQIRKGDNTLSMKVDGITTGDIKVPVGTYQDGRELADALQRAINSDKALQHGNASVKVNYLANQFVISSNRKGSNSHVDVISSASDIRALGIDPAKGLAGENVEGTIGNMPATGDGQKLTGRGKAHGIVIDVLGGRTGARGKVMYSRGVAEQLGGILDNFLGSNGLLANRNKGYQDRIKDIDHQRASLNRRLGEEQKRLTKKFSDLDETIGKMHSTSKYLAQQLAHLPGASKPK